MSSRAADRLRLRPLPESDPRVAAPVYTVRESAAYLGLPYSTFHTWVRGYERRPSGRPPVVGAAVVHALASEGRSPTVPFLGLVEGHVLSGFRRAGVSLPRIRAALAKLAVDVGVPHALASGHLYSDGVELLYEYAEREGEEVIRSLTEVRSGQRVLRPVLEQYLKLITWDAEAWPRTLQLPGFARAEVIADPHRAFGRPVFRHGGARVEDVVDRFFGGDEIGEIAEDFGVPVGECLEAVRVIGRSRVDRVA